MATVAVTDDSPQWIGADVSSAIASNSVTRNDNDDDSTFLTHTSHPSAKGSVLHSILNSTPSNRNRNNTSNECSVSLDNDSDCVRGVLFGSNGCGKTSLAMDLAHAICSNNPCNVNNNTNNSSSSVSSDKVQNYSVAFIIHSSKRNNLNRCFPARCFSKDSTADIGNEFEWNLSALSRIQIKYISSCSDLIRYLLSIQVLPPRERPLGGIIIDDLHLILGSDTPHGSDVAMNSNMKVIQVLACLEDTRRFMDTQWVGLDECHIPSQVRRTSLLVTLDTSMFNISYATKSLMTNWLEHSFTVNSDQSDNLDSSHVWVLTSSKLNEHEKVTGGTANYVIEEMKQKGSVLSWTC